MAFDLSRPLADWPLLLCGPILRRVTPSSVAVFIATSKACDVRLKIRNRGGGANWIAISPAAPTRQIGQRLHVVVVELVGQSLAPGHVYEYDVEMTPTGSVGEGLADQPGLVTDQVPIGYVTGALPSFSLPQDLASMRILHGSCRKPHGGGPDALAIADDLIRASYVDSANNAQQYAQNRPHLLLLTGDQIYADDVSGALLQSLRSAANDLMGTFTEVFPPDITADAPALRPGQNRASWLAHNSKLTSEHRDNHLMFLGEFYAMYLYVWSDVLWPTVLWGRTLWADETVLYPSSQDPNLSKDAKRKLEETLKTERAATREAVSFAVDVARVRRALANVPTMMAFDDHEITDDWNIDKEWDRQARQDPPLNRIVRNGLAAYAIFQAWGNNPDRFRSGKGLALLDALSKPTTGGGAVPLALTNPPDPSVATLLDVGPTAAANADRVLWDWTLDGPGMRVIALDSRTHRDFSESNHTGLLKPSEITRQLADNKPPAGDTRLCFVIAPAPVIGHPLVEEIAQPLMAATKTSGAGRRAADAEAWSAKQGTLQQMLSTLAGFGRVVVLSGDVHYAFTNVTAYHSADRTVHSRIVQLCSSAQKNTDSMTKVIQAAGYAGFERVGRSWLGTNRLATAADLGPLMSEMPEPTTNHPWDARQLFNIIDALGVTLSLGHAPAILAKYAGKLARRVLEDSHVDDALADEALVSAYWVLLEARLNESPLVLPSRPWFDNDKLTSAAHLLDLDPTHLDPNTWKYHTEYVGDEREPAVRFTVTTPGNNPVQQSAGSGNRQIIAQATHIVGFPNIGEITVAVPGGVNTPATKVNHRLHWLLPDRQRAVTIHRATLTPPVTSTGIGIPLVVLEL